MKFNRQQSFVDVVLYVNTFTKSSLAHPDSFRKALQAVADKINASISWRSDKANRTSMQAANTRAHLVWLISRHHKEWRHEDIAS
jgi:hypothetical protein